jgi:GNAT superfamily N-acetyltransferase
MESDLWRFVDTPAGVIPGMVALDGDRVIASYTAWPITLRIGGETVQGAQSMDTMTDPDFRGRGLFVALAAASYAMMAEAGYDIIYGFPNDSSFPGFMRRLEWTHIGDVPVLKRVVAPLPAMLDPVPLMTVKAWHGRLDSDTDWTIEETDVSAATLAGLPRRSRDDDVHLRRDTAWFAWRYHSHSQNPYRMITVHRDRVPRAALVYHEEGNRGVLAETLGDTAALQAGILRYVQLARQRGVRVITAMTTDAASVELLRRAGFWFRGHERLIVRRLSDRPLRVDPFDLQNWTLYGGDHDVY